MATRGLGAKLGWDEGEAKEFSKALKQSLMVQTPLQVVLETLFSRIQSQASMFQEFNKRLERIEARDLGGEELLSRLKVCEDGLAAINHEKLSPFHQQDIISRLEELEMQVSSRPMAMPGAASSGGAVVGTGSTGANGAAAGSASPSQLPGSMSRRSSGRHNNTVSGTWETRLEAMEEKLAGVYNLNGKLIALEHVAAELGVDIPDTEQGHGAEGDHPLPAGRAPGGSRPSSTAPTVPALSLDHAVSFQPHTTTTASVATSPGAPSALSMQGQGQPRTPPAGAASSPRGGEAGASSRPGSAGGPPELRRSMSGAVRVSDVMARVEELQAENEELRRAVESLQAEVTALGGSAAEGRAGLEGVGARVEALEAGARDLRANLGAEIAAAKKAANREPEVSFADFTALSSRAEAVAAEAAAASAAVAEVRDKALPAVNEALSDLKDQVKKGGEPREMDSLFHSRIAKLEAAVGDIRAEVQAAVADVLDDVVRAEDIAAFEEALDSKAEQADVRQLAAQQAALAQSVNGMAEWLAVRPDTADGARGTGASATKFKCLTCDRELKSQPTGASPDAVKAKGSFLPKLDNLPAAHPGPPVGPGINAAEMRRLVDEKLMGTGRKVSPPRGAEVEDYGGGGGGSPQRAKSGRQAIPMTNSALVPKAVPGQQRTPVFL